MWFRMATVSTSASTAERSRPRGAGLAVAALLLWPALAGAGPRLDSLKGHIAFGYGKLFAEAAPGGSISFAGGVEYPVRPHWTAGIEVGDWLLGTRLLESGTLSGQLDYSVFEASVLLRWQADRHPFQVYFGPSAFHARADLTSAAPATFEDQAVEETVAGFAFGATLIQIRPAPVRAGLEVATRELWLPNHVFGVNGSPQVFGVRMPTWSLATVRLAIHY